MTRPAANPSYALPCPACGHAMAFTVDTRATSRYIRRRRQCAQCGERYTTREILATEHENPEQAIGDVLVEALRQALAPRDEALRAAVASLTERVDRLDQAPADLEPWNA